MHDPIALPDGQPFAFWDDRTVYTRELHVSSHHPNASDRNDGSEALPFRTIGAAVRVATPGTKVRIHAGVYRETVSPERGGSGSDGMICYEPFGDGEVIIAASVVAGPVEKSSGWSVCHTPGVRIWSTRLNVEQYRGYNPFCAVNMPHDREYVGFVPDNMNPGLARRGVVFVDGRPLKQVSHSRGLAKEDGTYWVETNGLIVHFRLKDDADPAEHLIELSCREQCFTPRTPFLGYIRVKGLTFAHASMGMPVPQVGALSCHRGHHWIVEDCTVNWSNAVGIDCANQCWNRDMPDEPIVGTILRRNTIQDAGVCGIAGIGSRGLLIEDNLISGTGWQGMEMAWESAGIKLHCAVDGLIRRNVIRDCYRCDSLWLDYDNRNTRVTGNLFLGGTEMREHIFLECNRGPEVMVDNNIIWDVKGRYAAGVAQPPVRREEWHSDVDHELVNGYGIYMEGCDESRIVHNLIGRCAGTGVYAKTVPYRICVAGRGGTSRDNIIENNIFYDCIEAAIKLPTHHNQVEGNAYTKMPPEGGYLRVNYPPPPMCLDLHAWRRFFGFDMHGSIDVMEITVDANALTMTLELPEQSEPPTPRDATNKAATNTDFHGKAAPDIRPPGPFASLTKGKTTVSIDPRR